VPNNDCHKCYYTHSHIENVYDDKTTTSTTYFRLDRVYENQPLSFVKPVYYRRDAFSAVSPTALRHQQTSGTIKTIAFKAQVTMYSHKHNDYYNEKVNHPCCMAMRTKPFLSFSVSVKLPGRASNASTAPPTRRTTALPRPLWVTKYSMLRLLQEQKPVHKYAITQTYNEA